jgi:hypothetical protein
MFQILNFIIFDQKFDYFKIKNQIKQTKMIVTKINIKIEIH